MGKEKNLSEVAASLLSSLQLEDTSPEEAQGVKSLSLESIRRAEHGIRMVTNLEDIKTRESLTKTARNLLWFSCIFSSLITVTTIVLTAFGIPTLDPAKFGIANAVPLSYSLITLVFRYYFTRKKQAPDNQ